MRLALTALAATVVLSAGCAKSRLAGPAAAPDVSGRLAQAGGLMRTGCFDCLEEALAEYEAVRDVPNLQAGDADAATDGAIRSALLLELRQRELGMADDGYLQRARDLIETRPDRAAAFAPHLYTVESIPRRDARFAAAADPDGLRRTQELRAKFPGARRGAARGRGRRSARGLRMAGVLLHAQRQPRRSIPFETLLGSARRCCATRQSSSIAWPPVRGPSRSR